MVAQEYIQMGYPTRRVLKILHLAVSSFYYKPKLESQARGKKPSQYTLNQFGQAIPNEVIVADIVDYMGREFVDYGYRKFTHWLAQFKGYKINQKKVYRLMKESDLLKKCISHKASTRQWVSQLVPQTDGPFDYLEIDIKYVFIHRMGRNALLLNVIDVESRWLLGHYLAWDIQYRHVKKLFEQIFQVYPLPIKFYLRSDNGPQFIADEIQKYFQIKGIEKEYCKPSTPEQNAHIESYHSIIESLICKAYEWESITEAADTFTRFAYFYNFERIHSGVGYIPPFKYLHQNNVFLDDIDLKNVLDCSNLNLILVT